MKKYNLLLFLFILPTISTSRTIKKRRRPSIDHQYPILDQIAQANTWKSPNRIISASYLRNADTGDIDNSKHQSKTHFAKHSGHVNNANLMINLIPHQAQRHSVDMAASETLSNAQTAAEYVTRALQMRKQLHDKAPHSSYVKYDIFEKEQMQHLHPTHGKNRRPVTYNTKADAVAQHSKVYEDYRKPGYLQDFGEGEYMYKESNHKFNGHYDSHGDDNYDNNFKPSRVADIPKEELIKHIEKSVVRYMKRLESEGNLPKVSTPRPHTEIKTYYRIPKLNTQERVKDYTEYTSTESELFKPAPTKYYKTYKSPNKGTYTTVSTPYPEESDTTVMSVSPNIDLTFRSKARPKPIDLSALDVGQSWSHGSSVDNYAKSKPKLKFNSQTYQDINAMTYTPDRGLVQEESSYTQSDGYPYASTESVYYEPKLKDGMANVGASITVREKLPGNSDEAMKDLQDHHRKPLQIINGIPVLNPYKLNMDTLKNMFGGDPEELVKEPTSYNWQPFHPSDNRQKPHKNTSSVNNSNLPYDSYNPKYNNNPEGQGYQDHHWQPSENSHRQRGTIGSDMHSSSSSTSPKKIPNTTTLTIHKHKRKKNKTKLRIMKSCKNTQDLQTELRPPPTQPK